jgi:hypothetical protein
LPRQGQCIPQSPLDPALQLVQVPGLTEVQTSLKQGDRLVDLAVAEV